MTLSSLRRLRWLATGVPVVYLVFIWVLAHDVVPASHHYPWVLLLAASVILSIALFSAAMFVLFARLEDQLVSQNRELGRRNDELAGLLEVGRAASQSPDLAEMLRHALDAVLHVTAADEAEIWLRTDAELTLALQRRARGEAVRAPQHRVRVGEGVIGIAASGATPLVVRDLPGEAGALRDEVRSRGFAAFTALPLHHRSETIGVLGLAARDPSSLGTDVDFALLEGIGGQVAMAIVNLRLHENELDSAVLEERVRIAHELHDGVAQLLGYINTQTLAITKLVGDGKVEEAELALESMGFTARQAYGDVRAEILGLRGSAAAQSLVAGLRRHCREIGPSLGVEVALDIAPGVEDMRVPRATEIQLLRIVQEALRNVGKHAHAHRAVVRVALEDELLAIDVTDDGKGFDPGRSSPTGWPHFGLQTMRERALAVGGSLDILAEPGRGTTIRVRAPVERGMEVADARAAG